jgi:hypothetical protein
MEGIDKHFSRHKTLVPFRQQQMAVARCSLLHRPGIGRAEKVVKLMEL